MRFLLLLLPAMALASMEVEIRGKVFFDGAPGYILENIDTNGFEKWAITDNDLVAFEIHYEDLKSVIEKYYGKRPDQIYFTRDTPWGDLNNKLGCKKFDVIMEPDKPQILEITSKEVMLTQDIYENESNKTKRIWLIDTTNDKVMSVWNSPSNVSPNNVGVKIKLTFEVENDLVSVDHTYSFGISRRTVEDEELKKYRSGAVKLAAGQKVLAQLKAKKGTLKFQIPYKVYLSGSFTVNYDDVYKNKHFHCLDINQVLGNRIVLVYQTLFYEFHYGEHWNVVDSKDGHTVVNIFTVKGRNQ